MLLRRCQICEPRLKGILGEFLHSGRELTAPQVLMADKQPMEKSMKFMLGVDEVWIHYGTTATVTTFHLRSRSCQKYIFTFAARKPGLSVALVPLASFKPITTRRKNAL